MAKQQTSTTEIKELDTAFELAWRNFRATKRGKHMLMVKYAAKFFFLAGILFMSDKPEDYKIRMTTKSTIQQREIGK